MFLKMNENTVLCTWIKNSLDPFESAFTIATPCTGERTRSYVKSFVDPDNVVIARNGQVLSEEDNPILESGDHICFCIAEGENGLRIIGAVGLAILAFYVMGNPAYGLVW